MAKSILYINEAKASLDKTVKELQVQDPDEKESDMEKLIEANGRKRNSRDNKQSSGQASPKV